MSQLPQVVGKEAAGRYAAAQARQFVSAPEQPLQDGEQATHCDPTIRAFTVQTHTPLISAVQGLTHKVQTSVVEHSEQFEEQALVHTPDVVVFVWKWYPVAQSSQLLVVPEQVWHVISQILQAPGRVLVGKNPAAQDWQLVAEV